MAIIKQKKLTKKQRNSLVSIFKNKDLTTQGHEIEIFVKQVVEFLSKYIVEFKIEDNCYYNKNMPSSKAQLAQKGYPVFWGNVKRINKEMYWKNRLLNDTAATYKKLELYEVDIINAFIAAKGNIAVYIAMLEANKDKIEHSNTSNNSIFSSLSFSSVVGISWEASYKSGFFIKRTKIRLFFKEQDSNNVLITVQLNGTKGTTYNCNYIVDKENNVIIKSLADNGKTFYCAFSAKNKQERTNKLNVILKIESDYFSISKQLVFHNRDMVFLSLLGIICHISETANHFLGSKKSSVENKEFMHYFDQISKHVVYKPGSKVDSQFENKVKLLAILPYPIYIASVICAAFFGYYLGNNIQTYFFSSLVFIVYAIIAEQFLLIKIFKSFYNIENCESTTKADLFKLYVLVLLLLSLPIVIVSLFFYLVRQKVNLNYTIGLFRARNNVFVRRVLQFGVNAMPWIHLSRKMWLYKNVSHILNTLVNNDNINNEKVIALNIGSGLDWLFPYLSKNQTYKNIVFAEADLKSIIASKHQLLKNVRLFKDENFAPRLSLLPLNLSENGIEPVLSYFNLCKCESESNEIPLVLMHEAVMCYTSQHTITTMLMQLSKCNIPIIIIGDWEICMTEYNYHSEEDSGLFRLFRSLRFNNENTNIDISVEKYGGKFRTNEFKQLIAKYGFELSKPHNSDIFKYSEDKLSKDLILDYENYRKKNPLNIISRFFTKYNHPVSKVSPQIRDMGYLMVLANEKGKKLLEQ